MPLETGHAANCFTSRYAARVRACTKSAVINARFIRGRVSSRDVKAPRYPPSTTIPVTFRLRHRLHQPSPNGDVRQWSRFLRIRASSNSAQIPERGKHKIPFHCVSLPSTPTFLSRRSRGALKFIPGCSSGNLTAPGRRFLPLCIPYYCCYVARRVA